MKLDKMLKALEAEAKESADKVIAEVKAQAKEILAEAKKNGEEQADRVLEKVNQKLKLEQSKTLSNANFEAKKAVLEAKEEVIEKLFAKTKKEAAQDLGSDAEFFKGLAKEALSKFDGQEVKVLVNPKSKDMAEKVMSEIGGHFSVENSLNSIGGLKMISQETKVIVDNTIESRLEKVRQLYEPQIISELFGGVK